MTKETAVEAVEPVMATRDTPEEVEIVEEVVIDDPPAEPRPDIEQVIAEQEDPRKEIYARQREKREKEIADQTGGFGELEEENSEFIVDDDGSGAIIDPTPEPPDTPPDSDEMVTVRIAGIDRQVLKKKVDDAGGPENYSIRIAAQEQMERNAHEAQRLAAKEQLLAEQEQQIAARLQAGIPATDSQQGQNPDDLPSDGQNLEESARRYQEAVYDDAADAPSILVQTVQAAADAAVRRAQGQGQPFDEAELRRQVKEDVLAEQRQAKIVKASHSLIAAHPELNQRNPQYDPRMFSAIDSETMVVEREHPEWEPDEIVQEAYDRINKWKGGSEPGKTMSDKQAEKQAMIRPRVGTQRYSPPPEPPRETRSDYVQKERQRRGLE